MTTQNTQNDASAFDALAATLEGFGFALTPATRLAFGKNVASALKGIKSGGFVVVMTKGTQDADATRIAAHASEHKTMVAVVDARDADFQRVRSNVASFLKSRKIGATISKPRKNDDDDNVGFVVLKPKQ